MDAGDIGRVIPLDGPSLTPDELEALVEVAYRAIVADGRIDESEIEAFRSVLSRLRALATSAVGGAYRSVVVHEPPRPVTDGELDALLDRLGDAIETPSTGRQRFGFARQSTLRALAAPLPAPARELAYKVAYAITLADMDVTTAEDELRGELAAAFEIDDARASALDREVLAALNPIGDDG